MGKKNLNFNDRADMYRVAYEQSLSERDGITSDVDTLRAFSLKAATIGLLGLLAALQFSVGSQPQERTSTPLWWVGIGIGLGMILCAGICIAVINWKKTFLGARTSAKCMIIQDIEGKDCKTRKVKNLGELYRRMAMQQEERNDKDYKTVENMLRARTILIIVIGVEYVGVLLAFFGGGNHA